MCSERTVWEKDKLKSPKMPKRRYEILLRENYSQIQKTSKKDQ